MQFGLTNTHEKSLIEMQIMNQNNFRAEPRTYAINLSPSETLTRNLSRLAIIKLPREQNLKDRRTVPMQP